MKRKCLKVNITFVRVAKFSNVANLAIKILPFNEVSSVNLIGGQLTGYSHELPNPQNRDQNCRRVHKQVDVGGIFKRKVPRVSPCPLNVATLARNGPSSEFRRRTSHALSP